MTKPITGQTRLAGLFALPARHSISPIMHTTAFQALGIDAVYLAFDVEPENLTQAVAMIKQFDMLGVNLSMPHKMAGLELMDELSDAAKLIGAINTIVPKDGKLIGHNTDGVGFMRALAAEDVAVIGQEITIIGAGGAATAIISQAALDGVKAIHVFNRKDAFFDKIQDKLTTIKEATGCQITLTDLADHEALQTAISNSALLVNATGVGMKPHDDLIPLSDLTLLRSDLAVFDVIYNPRKTLLLAEAEKVGAKTLNGLGMLLYQGAAAFELWTGEKMPIDLIKPLVENS